MDFYQANLDAIKTRSDIYYHLLRSQPTQRKLKIKDKPEEADKVLKTLKKHENNGAIVIFGFGEGCLAEKALDVMGKGFALVIYEYNIPQFNRVLHMKDFSHLNIGGLY